MPKLHDLAAQAVWGVPWKLPHQLLVQLMQQQMINFHGMSNFVAVLHALIMSMKSEKTLWCRSRGFISTQVLDFHNVSAQVVLHDAWGMTHNDCKTHLMQPLPTKLM